MELLNSLGKMLAGGKRQEGENLEKYNKRSHEAYKSNWTNEKKRSGQWLSKEDYEKKTGRPGRKD